MTNHDELYQCEIFDERRQLDMDELCQVCEVQQTLVIELVNEGVLDPIHDNAGSWLFTSISIKRVRTAVRLQHDLGLNLAGIALVLEMLEELEALRRRSY